jgi:hypothetical protein
MATIHHREVHMGFDFDKEKPLSLADAAKRLPSLRTGKTINPFTITRWIQTGTLLRDGTRCRLEAIRVGNSWVTSAEAINRYLAALTAACLAPDTPTSTPTPRSPSKRKRASASADETLAESGW